MDVLEFLDRDGGMGLLLAIDTESGTLHTEFENKMTVSRATVSTRIDEAKELDLLEINWLSDDHGNAKRYVLSQIGRVFRVALESVELDESYQTYLQAERELEDGKEAVADWISEHEDFWIGKDLEREFSLSDPLKDADTYPGDSMESDFVDFLVGEKPLYRKLKEAKKRDSPGGDEANSGERDSSS